jgi:hypothetical protein
LTSLQAYPSLRQKPTICPSIPTDALQE